MTLGLPCEQSGTLILTRTGGDGAGDGVPAGGQKSVVDPPGGVRTSRPPDDRPIPPSATTAVPLAASLEIVSVPVRRPAVAGVNVTARLHAGAWAARVNGL